MLSRAPAASKARFSGMCERNMSSESSARSSRESSVASSHAAGPGSRRPQKHERMQRCPAAHLEEDLLVECTQLRALPQRVEALATDDHRGGRPPDQHAMRRGLAFDPPRRETPCPRGRAYRTVGSTSGPNGTPRRRAALNRCSSGPTRPSRSCGRCSWRCGGGPWRAR